MLKRQKATQIFSACFYWDNYMKIATGEKKKGKKKKKGPKQKN